MLDGSGTKAAPRLSPVAAMLGLALGIALGRLGIGAPAWWPVFLAAAAFMLLICLWLLLRRAFFAAALACLFAFVGEPT